MLHSIVVHGGAIFHHVSIHTVDKFPWFLSLLLVYCFPWFARLISCTSYLQAEGYYLTQLSGGTQCYIDSPIVYFRYFMAFVSLSGQ